MGDATVAEMVAAEEAVAQALMARVADRIGAVLGSHHGGFVDVFVDPLIGEGLRASIRWRYDSMIHVDAIGIDDPDVLVKAAERAAVSAARRAVRDLRGVADALQRGVDEYEESCRG